MKNLIGSLVLILALVSCGNNENEKAGTPENSKDTHKVVVLDVLQASAYTYLYTEENGKKLWLAVPKTTAQKNDVLYYDNGMLMENFHSNDLNRDFDKVLFLENVRKTPTAENSANTDVHETSMSHTGSPQIEKEDFKVSPVSGGITIAELYKNKADYAGKTIKIAGKVVKFNEAIMNKNWVHIQDGTEFDGNFDLTVTTQSVVKKGDNVIFEGTVALDKDFGYGYSYKILLEDAVLK